MIKTQAYAALSPRAKLQPFTIERRSPGADDVQIDILHCGICHSDLHKVNDDWGGTHYPLVPGHEIVGRVAVVGSNVTRFAPGDLVGVGCIVDSCRSCAQCLAGREMFCQKGVSYVFDSVEQDKSTRTHGGYSTMIVVKEDYVLRMPASLDPVGAAPLLCAGITTYSPLRQFNVGPGSKVGIVGLGGLGHLAVKFAVTMGAEVTVLSTTREKEKDARRLGATRFIATKEPGALEAAAGSLDLIVDTVSAPHDVNALLPTLRTFGTLVLVGVPPKDLAVAASSLISGNKKLAGSNIGGIPETQEMLDFAGEHGVVADIETIAIEDVNDAYERMERGDVRYRFVIDMAALQK